MYRTFWLSFLVKLRYSKKATTLEKNLPLGTSSSDSFTNFEFTSHKIEFDYSCSQLTSINKQTQFHKKISIVSKFVKLSDI